MVRMRLVWTLLCCFALASCQPQEPDPPPATVRESTPPPSSPSPSPSPATESFAVPEVIDEPYVERVLNRLYQIDGDAVRMHVEAGEITAEVEALTRAINTTQQADGELQIAREVEAGGFQSIRRPPGDSLFTVADVLTGQPDCIWVVGLRNFDEVTVTPLERTGEQDYVQLVPDPNPSPINPTGWLINFGRLGDVGAEVPNPCAG